MIIAKRTALLLGTLALAGAAFAADSNLDKADRKFIEKAAAGGMFEVEAGKLAQSKGASEGVKSFGSMLEKDHAAANEELKALAAKKGVEVPAAMPKDMQSHLDKLGKAKDFDKEFIKDVGLHDHKKDIADFEKASKKAKDPDVKAFAAKALPVLRKHHQEAESLQKAVKTARK
jgi:putative membrane protein